MLKNVPYVIVIDGGGNAGADGPPVGVFDALFPILPRYPYKRR